MHPELIRGLEDTGLIYAHTWDWEATEFPAQANSEETEILALEVRRRNAPMPKRIGIYRFERFRRLIVRLSNHPQ